MVELLAKSPLEGLLPRAAGGVQLRETAPAFITGIAPFAGKEKPCSEALEKAHGLGLPGVGRSSRAGAQTLLWAGRGQYLLLGDRPAARAIARHAALVDQSDGWAVMALEGEGAEAVMARLCPLDLRAGSFRRGHVARSELAHMMALVARRPKGLRIMVMASFAACAAERIAEAMESVATQGV